MEGHGLTQVVDNKRVGDRGLEPLTSTVWRKDRKKEKVQKIMVFPCIRPVFWPPGFRWI
jgi:hypothetical protein